MAESNTIVHVYGAHAQTAMQTVHPTVLKNVLKTNDRLPLQYQLAGRKMQHPPADKKRETCSCQREQSLSQGQVDTKKEVRSVTTNLQSKAILASLLLHVSFSDYQSF